MRHTVGIVFALTLMTGALPTQDVSVPAHDTVFYKSGALNIEAYVYVPPGAGPFPLVIYNHGSRAAQERTERPFGFVARLLVPAGYAVMVPERRGYGKSDGRPFTEEIGPDRGDKFISRMEDEAADVNAAVEYATAHLSVDPKRIAVIGYSFGGIVTTIAASRSSSFSAIVNQAPGALNWKTSERLRATLVAAAGKIHAPMLCLAAENDATTENAIAVCGAAKAHGGSTNVIIYPPFTDPLATNAAAPGHAIFGAGGVDIWKADVLAFLHENAAARFEANDTQDRRGPER